MADEEDKGTSETGIPCIHQFRARPSTDEHPAIPIAPVQCRALGIAHKRLLALLGSATSSSTGAADWGRCSLQGRGPRAPGQPVGGRTSQSDAAPGSDDHCLLLDASGSASGEAWLRRRCPGKGREQGGTEGGGGLTGRGLGLRGGACGGGAEFGGGCFHPGLGPPSSAGAARLGGVSGLQTDA